MKTLALIFIALLFCIVSFSQTPEQKKSIDRASMAKEIALQSNIAEDWKAAIDEYKKLIGIFPDYSPAYYEIGLSYKKIQDYDNAISYFKKYLIYDPNSKYKEDIMTDINKLEYLKDRNTSQIKDNESIMGLWSSVQKNIKDNIPYWIFKIDEFNGELRVSLDPKSENYRTDYTYPTAIALKKGSKINFMFTTDATTDIKGGLNQASDVLNAVDLVANTINPLNNIPFGVAGDVLSMIPSSGTVNEKTQIVFSLELKEDKIISGKINIKKYLSNSSGIKIVSDEIKEITLNKETADAFINLKNEKCKNRNPAISSLLSVALPGMGQYYNKQGLKGSILLFGYSALMYAAIKNGFTKNDDNIAIFFFEGIIICYSAIDANICSRRFNKKNNTIYGNVFQNKHYNIAVAPFIRSEKMISYSPLCSGLSLTMRFN
mgnify:CR=1 FL=1